MFEEIVIEYYKEHRDLSKRLFVSNKIQFYEYEKDGVSILDLCYIHLLNEGLSDHIFPYYLYRLSDLHKLKLALKLFDKHGPTKMLIDYIFLWIDNEMKFDDLNLTKFNEYIQPEYFDSVDSEIIQICKSKDRVALVNFMNDTDPKTMKICYRNDIIKTLVEYYDELDDDDPELTSLLISSKIFDKWYPFNKLIDIIVKKDFLESYINYCRDNNQIQLCLKYSSEKIFNYIIENKSVFCRTIYSISITQPQQINNNMLIKFIERLIELNIITYDIFINLVVNYPDSFPLLKLRICELYPNIFDNLTDYNIMKITYLGRSEFTIFIIDMIGFSRLKKIVPYVLSLLTKEIIEHYLDNEEFIEYFKMELLARYYIADIGDIDKLINFIEKHDIDITNNHNLLFYPKITNFDIIRYLINCGIDPNVKNREDQTFVYYRFTTIRMNDHVHTENVFNLIRFMKDEYDYDFNTVDDEGNNCLEYVLLSNNIDFIKYMIKLVNPHHKNRFGQNLLHRISNIDKIDLDIIKYLIDDVGIDVYAIDNNGLNAFDNLYDGSMDLIMFLYNRGYIFENNKFLKTAFRVISERM